MWRPELVLGPVGRDEKPKKQSEHIDMMVTINSIAIVVVVAVRTLLIVIVLIIISNIDWAASQDWGG